MQDVYQIITDQIVAAIEAGTAEWHMPWHVKAMDGDALPFNTTSRKHYRGINTLVLWSVATRQGYASNEWGTYKQWAERGAQVRKGERGTTIVFWKFFAANAVVPDDAEGSSAPARQRAIARGYTVFHAAQVDGYVAKPMPAIVEQERDATAEAWFAATGAAIAHGGSRAFYSQSQDRIQMPAYAAFSSPAHYYGTLAHECVHWTGAKSRCDRQFGARFGDEAYAAEELVAELGAAYQCASLRIDSTPRPDHAAYIASWLKVLKGDKRAIFTAASKAQAAVDYLASKQTIEEEPEMLLAA